MGRGSGFSIKDIISTLGGRLLHGHEDVRFSDYCIDSRYVGDSTVFVPLMGQSRDGHQFVIDSLSKGAVATIVRSGHQQVHEILNWLNDQVARGYTEYEDVCVIEVRHTLVALQKLAGWFRRQHTAQVIGITGSVGKTGTKEMLIQLLNTKYDTVGTEKNFNNEIGVPLALSKITPNTEMAVVEMAMRARGEISLLSRIVQPDLAVITNTAGSHVGRLGSFDEVVRAKCEIADGMLDGSTMLLNRSDANVLRCLDQLGTRNNQPRKLNFHYFDPSASLSNTALPPFLTPGEQAPPEAELPTADVWAEDVKLRGLDGSVLYLCSKDERVETHLSMLGRGAVENLTCAAAIAVELGMSLEEVAEVAPSLLPAPQRLNLFRLGPETYLVDDCYNSSPASMMDSLELLLEIGPEYRKILIMGDMLELGKFETLLHRQTALSTLNSPLNAVFAVGPRMNAVNEVLAREDVELFYIEGHSSLRNGHQQSYGQRFGGGNHHHGRGGRSHQRPESTEILDDQAAAKLSALLLNQLSQDSQPTVILVKGSRAIHLERVVNDLLAETGR